MVSKWPKMNGNYIINLQYNTSVASFGLSHEEDRFLEFSSLELSYKSVARTYSEISTSITVANKDEKMNKVSLKSCRIYYIYKRRNY